MTTRGRVVMLVDNDVRGDSRVQKEARSMAAAGWEVILLGERRDAPLETWMIGAAQVRLVPMDNKLMYAPSTWRRGWLRRPFAYPPGREAEYRLELAKARRIDIGTRLAELAAKRRAGGSAVADATGKAALLVPRASSKAQGLWTRFRAREARRLREVRRDGSALLNRAPVLFWRVTMGDRAWRKLDPSLWQWEIAFRNVIDELKPDIIHANDFRMLAVGARAKIRANAKGRPVKLVWDAHEYAARPGAAGRVARLAAAVTRARGRVRAVRGRRGHASPPPLATLLQQEHGLAAKPNVVMNAPVQAPAADEDAAPLPDLRADCGIGPGRCRCSPTSAASPRCAAATPSSTRCRTCRGCTWRWSRCTRTARNSPVDKARARAEDLGVADRVHMLPYVPHWQVSDYLGSADTAVSPLHHLPNHEIALSNKFFEYAHARLPLITSDIRTMAEMVRSTGQGEVFKAQDLDDFVRVVRTVLADPQRYRDAYDRDDLLLSWTWEAQAAVLDQVYGSLMPDAAPASLPVTSVEPAPVEPLPQVEGAR